MSRKKTFTLLSLFLLLFFATSIALGLNYMYFSHSERTVFGDYIKFQTGDTLNGNIRTNGCLACQGSPAFLPDAFLIAVCDSNFHCFSDHLFQNSPVLPLPEQATWLREQAILQTHYFDAGNDSIARVKIEDHNLRIWWTLAGTPIDTNAFVDYALPDSAIVYFNCTIRVFGTVYTTLILCTAGNGGLEDNILYASANPDNGVAPANHSEKFALVAEGDIKVLNTIANGRENSGLPCGNFNGFTINHSRNSIVLDGFFFALGHSFTFENQNDPDSGYVYGCVPDRRGQIFIYGGLAQRNRGYVHRSNLQSTGYLKQYRFDQELEDWNIGVFQGVRENLIEPQSLEIRNIIVGQTATDTLRIRNDFVPIGVTQLSVSAPFSVPFNTIDYQWQLDIPVSFTPPDNQQYFDTLRFVMGGMEYSVPIYGNGLNPDEADEQPLIPQKFSLGIYPNPFNSNATFAFFIEKQNHVRLSLFDVLGREAKVLLDETMAAGEHRVNFVGGELSSGIYLAKLEAGNRAVVKKIMLLK